jgi:putative membrane protein
MMIAIPYLHYIGIMLLMGSLISEHLLLKPKMTKEQINSLAVTDLIYGMSALLVLATGLLRWFVYGKGSDYYLSNPLFHTKLTLFVILAILSIFPTIKFLKWRKQVNNGQEPDINYKTVKRLFMYIRLELLILAIIPLLAVMLARGTGIN